MEEVDEKFRIIEEKLKKKEYAEEKQPWAEHPTKMKRRLGLFVTLRQSNFPFKMFVLQEIFLEGEKEPELRLSYYIISPKKLKEKGKLHLMWGQYNPNIPKRDFIELMRRAKEKGIIEFPSYSP